MTQSRPRPDRNPAVQHALRACYRSGRGRRFLRQPAHGDRMKRREVITLIGGAAAWPVAAGAQQSAMPVVGFLHVATADPYSPMLSEFRAGLGDIGYIEGQNVAIEYRWANNQGERLTTLAADLASRHVSVIVA